MASISHGKATLPYAPLGLVCALRDPSCPPNLRPSALALRARRTPCLSAHLKTLATHPSSNPASLLFPPCSSSPSPSSISSPPRPPPEPPLLFAATPLILYPTPRPPLTIILARLAVLVEGKGRGRRPMWQRMVVRRKRAGRVGRRGGTDGQREAAGGTGDAPAGRRQGRKREGRTRERERETDTRLSVFGLLHCPQLGSRHVALGTRVVP